MVGAPKPRTGMPDVKLSRDEFKDRFRSQYVDPAFQPLAAELGRIADVARPPPAPHSPIPTPPSRPTGPRRATRSSRPSASMTTRRSRPAS